VYSLETTTTIEQELVDICLYDVEDPLFRFMQSGREQQGLAVVLSRRGLRVVAGSCWRCFLLCQANERNNKDEPSSAELTVGFVSHEECDRDTEREGRGTDKTGSQAVLLMG
jgi:hypothetical protein